MNCNPCRFCRHGKESRVRGEWFDECGLFSRPKVYSVRPCPYFQPRIISDQLIEQLEWERDSAKYTEDMIIRMAEQSE